MNLEIVKNKKKLFIKNIRKMLKHIYLILFILNDYFNN